MALAFPYEEFSLTSDSDVKVIGGSMTLLVGWVLARFKKIIPRYPEPEYKRVDPLVGKWKPLRG
ncbi:hypothetical protein MtrunA17_Chr7g0264011 [Medicago truncatula]|uniref:Uncharacterized protein n=1 Tax=Medicago truncatula TaxID=3880 RepID=A0A396H6P4_MEDTR|nr:hypothetical protein MtrunA17_Chr7g0264011 [Medicago truncatula]